MIKTWTSIHTVLPPLSLSKEKSILIRTILCNHYSFLYILLKWNDRRKLDFAAAIAVTALSTYGSFNFLRKWVLGENIRVSVEPK